MGSIMTDFVNMPYRVPYADTDQMGVVYYANFLVYFERVRNEMLRAIDYPYKQMEADGFMLPVLQAHVDYRQPALYDDLLTIGGRCEPLSRTRLKVLCRVSRGDDLLAEGHTIHACLSIETRRPARLPELFWSED